MAQGQTHPGHPPQQAEAELLIRRERRVLWLTLNRPARHNALSPTLYACLLDAVQQASRDDSIGAVVLSGAGGSFCAGGDVARMHHRSDAPVATPAERVRALRERTRIVEHLHHMPKPTIAMLRGHAVGAGLSLALACDLRYGDDSVKLRTGFSTVGLPGDFGGHYFLPRIVGAAKARELYLCASVVAAGQAVEWGLLNARFSAERLHQEVEDLAVRLANGPQPALAHIKANLNDGLSLSLEAMLARECERHVQCVDSPDHKEAVRAFAEKRAPVFQRLLAGGIAPHEP